MSLRVRVATLWRNVFQKHRADRELDDELSAYIDLVVAEKVRAGMTPDAARRAALVEMGGVEHVKENVRDVRAGAVIDNLRRDIHYAFRSLGRARAFSIASICALALGIGATAAVFSVVNGVLLRPLPYKDPDRLVVVLHEGTQPVAVANFIDWQRESRSFERMGAADYWTPNLAGTETPEKVWALKLTPDVFPLLGVQPARGRVFLPDEDQPGRDRVVVLSHSLWQRRYGADPAIVGREMVLNGQTYTIIGVMPESFRFAPFWATRAELWVPNSLADRLGRRGGNSLRVFARLRPGVTLAQARAEMATITARLEREYPGTNRNVMVVPLTERVLGGVRPALLILLGAVAFVLLIACANVAHLLLARAAARRREMAVRTTLGASPLRIVQQCLAEGLLLSLAGGLLGMLLARVGVGTLLSLAPSDLPRLEMVRLDSRVLGVAMGVALLTGLVFGIIPAVKALRAELGESLREGERGSTEGIARNRARSTLIVSEFALALVLLVGAGLMMRTFVKLRAIDPGFDPRNVVTMVVPIAGTAQQEPARRAPFFSTVLERVAAVPGVESASAINHLPLAGDYWGYPFWIEGRPTPKPGEGQGGAYRVVMADYFETMRIPLVHGRGIQASDRMDSPPVVVVNETLARRFWPGEDAVGKRLTLDNPTDPEPPVWRTVVGVAKDTRESDWTGEIWNEMYTPYLQNRQYLESEGAHVAYMTLVVRRECAAERCDASVLVPAVRDALSSIDRAVPLAEIQTMEQVVSAAKSDTRFYLTLLGAFAVVALLLAAVGIYGVMSYSVSRRTHEIGIRIALGAQPHNVLGLVIGQGMTLAIVGAVAGLAAALALSRLMSTLLYGVQATDALTFTLVVLVLVGVALLASYLPARRATRTDPLAALRHE
ncbi:MAG TPA: ABC transporter permease [Gemmatimonadaceae bacterium]|nr:ABC transporter permease [Gemmatimonadaceae bacterium]